MIKKFLFNEFGVCTNPDKTEIGSGIPHIEISTAYVRGKWTYGVTYMLADRGGAFGTNYFAERKTIFGDHESWLTLMAWAKTTESQRLSVGFEPIRRKKVSNESKTSKEDTSRFRKEETILDETSD